jgi:hypothetical protein
VGIRRDSPDLTPSGAFALPSCQPSNPRRTNIDDNRPSEPLLTQRIILGQDILVRVSPCRCYAGRCTGRLQTGSRTGARTCHPGTTDRQE